MSRRVEVSTHCPAPRRVMFDLARSQRAHTASMAWSEERIDQGPPDDLLGLGDEVTFAGRHFGIGFTLTGKITELVPYERFTDEQVRGPFRTLRHQHLFVDEPGGCVMIDRLSFTAPLGVLGLITESLVLRSYLTRLLRRRGAHLARLAAS